MNGVGGSEACCYGISLSLCSKMWKLSSSVPGFVWIAGGVGLGWDVDCAHVCKHINKLEVVWCTGLCVREWDYRDPRMPKKEYYLSPRGCWDWLMLSGYSDRETCKTIPVVWVSRVVGVGCEKKVKWVWRLGGLWLYVKCVAITESIKVMLPCEWFCSGSSVGKGVGVGCGLSGWEVGIGSGRPVQVRLCVSVI